MGSHMNEPRGSSDLSRVAKQGRWSCLRMISFCHSAGLSLACAASQSAYYAPCRAGQQITCAYNNGPNEVFLYRYGFVETGNPHDVFEAPSLLQRIRAVELIPHARFQRLRDLGLEDALSPARRVSLESRCAFTADTVPPMDRVCSRGGVLCLGLHTAWLLTSNSSCQLRRGDQCLTHTPQAEIARTGVDDEVLAAARLLLAPAESVGTNATAADFRRLGEPHEEQRMRQVGADAVLLW